ncbi:M1 family metallopeptidase [Amycolatopsis sp. H20-H5]|uniref:M1 family metallopeptidase n=1 Tax=Amycolatopsis sp. H20-H5 TaxID=3046309 RepID=UPI002DBA6C6A|nr:M1 family metallopeptidase [Amycolatopsis sp. H20-H5]MEC3975303.1 M1 family metallopeptidase [Amycolatopsis sp. H20-H5]
MRGRTRTGLGALALGVASVLLVGTASAAPAPGAPGVGDPYYPNAGNGGTDVLHYDIRLTYQPATDLLSGATTILLTATQDLSRFDLDFGLKASSVLVNNRPAQFANSTGNGEFVVTPASPLLKGQTAVVVVNYADTPSKVKIDGLAGWKKTPDGALAVDEPQSAAWWFPSNDHPTDKATYDVSVEVPNDVVAVSNGTLVRKTVQRAGWTRWNWRSTQPQATYLTNLVVGKYEVNQQTTPDGKPFITAYGADLGDSLYAAKASVERTPEINEFLASKFGPYPFEAQGGIVTTGIGFSLENQTRPTYGQKNFLSGANTTLIAHENAHQWFGDNVSLGKWSDIWLNEGFASYAELLWSEHEGEGTVPELAQYIYDSNAADAPLWKHIPADPGADNQFDNAVYDRGALTLQALRTAVGDDSFFKILQTWQATKKGKTGVIPEFIALAEKVSGKPLYDLFQTWLYTSGKPAVGPNGPAAAAATSSFGTAKQAEPKSYPQIERNHELLASAHEH